MIREPNNALVPAYFELVNNERDLWSIIYPYFCSFKNEIKPKPSPKNPPKVKI